MQEKRRGAYHLTYLVIAFLLVLGWCMVATPAIAEPYEARVGVWQKLDYQYAKSDTQSTFNYVLKAENPQNPLPKGAKDGLYTWTMTGDVHQDLVWDLPRIEGVYRYVLYQEPQKLDSAYTLDPAVYELEIYLPSNGEPLYIFKQNGVKVTDPGWTVYFQGQAPPAPSKIAQLVTSLTTKTGDMLMAVIPATLMVGLLSLMVLLFKRRRDKDKATDTPA